MSELREELLVEDLQNFYNAVTWLLSQAPSARVDEGASEAYHYAMQAVTLVREDLRMRGVVTHDESHWKAKG